MILIFTDLVKVYSDEAEENCTYTSDCKLKSTLCVQESCICMYGFVRLNGVCVKSNESCANRKLVKSIVDLFQWATMYLASPTLTAPLTEWNVETTNAHVCQSLLLMVTFVNRKVNLIANGKFLLSKFVLR